MKNLFLFSLVSLFSLTIQSQTSFAQDYCYEKKNSKGKSLEFCFDTPIHQWRKYQKADSFSVYINNQFKVTESYRLENCRESYYSSSICHYLSEDKTKFFSIYYNSLKACENLDDTACLIFIYHNETFQ